MKFIFASITILCFFFTGIYAQETNKKIFDEKSQTDILIGSCTREGLMSCEFANSMNEEYNSYLPEDSVTTQLRNKINDISCVLILGTWCGDSKEQVPRFFRILDLTNSSFEKFEMLCVDQEKNAPGLDVKQTYSIDKVPTFIFYRNGVEIGRIVETPKKRLEKDMLGIILVK